MKKLLVLITIIALAFGSTGATCMNSTLNSAPVDFVCNPTPAQQTTAAAMLAALDAAQAAGALFFPPLAIAQASAVLKVIQAGGCFLVAELKKAFEIVDAGNVTMTASKNKMLKGSAGPIPEYAALRIYVK